jgi:OmpA-OmpF porin, OOP family
VTSRRPRFPDQGLCPRRSGQQGVTMMTTARKLIFAGVAAALLPGIAIAQDTKNQGYLVDMYGNSISTSSNTGLCWRSSDWTPARSVEPCDPVARKAEAPAPRVAAAPAPPQKSAPAPTPAPAPMKMVPQSISFSADALFAFDKSVLKPEGVTALDDFARQLSGAQYETIIVTGHTDRFGSDEYNQKLSERRANTVRDHLALRGIPANRISAEGRGETQPVTRAGDCKGAKSAGVIACLQPDRRVHVEVTGTKGMTASPR